MQQPWAGDACSLVDAYRARHHSPAEEMEATLAAIEGSDLNAFCHVDAEAARLAAVEADVALPFGGVPVGVKELDRVEGWPAADASLVFADRVAEWTATCVRRLVAGGAVLAGQTTSSEFGGLNVSVSRLHGVTGNAWDRTRSAGGSSAGSASAVAGGLVPLATGSDGGGSIRIPAGFCGVVGLKPTFGRIPRGPATEIAPMTVVQGCLARSVRDVARHLDVCEGVDSHDPYSLPAVGGWERALGSHRLRGLRTAVIPDLGLAVVRREVAALVTEVGEGLADVAGMHLVDADVSLSPVSMEWALANVVTLAAELGDRYPDCAGELTTELGFAMAVAGQAFDLARAARVERARTEANEAFAALFDHVDVIICATNPDVAFGADVTLATSVGSVTVAPDNNGALTIPANLYGNPAISVPAGTIDGLPVGIQLIGRHHAEGLLLDLAGVLERERPWPLVAPRSSPAGG
jgi:aspartyl-tRNA(Asn)/glutamyl-tRNA(Gln) amidotransferase subunit A